MAKVTLDNLATTLANSAAAAINANNDDLEAAFENTLSRDGTGPNQMLADFDMNNNDILNVKDLDVDTLTIAGELVIPSDLAVIPLPETVMLKPDYDPDGFNETVFDKLPVMPEAFEGANDTARINTAAAFAVANQRPLHLTDGRTYTISQLTLPANLVITGRGVLRSDATLTGSNVTITLGANTIAPYLKITTPGSETNTDILSIGNNSLIGHLEIISDLQRAGGGITTAASGIHIDYLKTNKIDRPIHLNNTSLVAQTEDNYIGFIEAISYVRVFRADFCQFVVGGIKAVTRSANASKSPGHNVVLIVGCEGWSIGDVYSEDCGEHVVRIGGSTALPQVTKNYKIGVITAIRCGGCAFKVNPTLLVSAGVTEKAYNGTVVGVLGIDVGDPADAGNEELLRITHARQLNIGWALAYTDTDSVSSQYLCQINDSDGVTIGTLGGENANSGFLNFDGTSDVDGVATFGGDVTNFHVQRITGVMPGNNAIAVNTAFNLSNISMNFEGAQGWVTNLVRWDAGTLTGMFEVKGRVSGSVAPVFLTPPTSDNFQVDLSYSNTRLQGRAVNLRSGVNAVLQMTQAAFDGGNVLPTGVFLNAAQVAAAQGSYGAVIEWSRLASSRRGAAIALYQSGAAGNNTGLSFWTGGSIAATDALLESMRISGERALMIPDGVLTNPTTTTGWAQIYVDSVDGDLKIKFGDGVVKLIVTDV